MLGGALQPSSVSQQAWPRPLPYLLNCWTSHLHVQWVDDRECCMGDAGQVSFLSWCANTECVYQTKIPSGATLLGIILSSNKTNVSVLVGDQCAHPLLLGLANLHMSTCLKLSSDTFLLTALLLIPKFIHKSRRICGLLADQLIHESLNIVLQLLKDAAHFGIMMNDPLRNLWFCLTPLASYIVDIPEACMLAGVARKTSPITTAMYKQFGNLYQHPLHKKPYMLKQLQQINVNPNNLQWYLTTAQNLCLNGITFPFFRDWCMADPQGFWPQSRSMNGTRKSGTTLFSGP